MGVVVIKLYASTIFLFLFGVYLHSLLVTVLHSNMKTFFHNLSREDGFLVDTTDLCHNAACYRSWAPTVSEILRILNKREKGTLFSDLQGAAIIPFSDSYSRNRSYNYQTGWGYRQKHYSTEKFIRTLVDDLTSPPKGLKPIAVKSLQGRTRGRGPWIASAYDMEKTNLRYIKFKYVIVCLDNITPCVELLEDFIKMFKSASKSVIVLVSTDAPVNSSHEFEQWILCPEMDELHRNKLRAAYSPPSFWDVSTICHDADHLNKSVVQ